MISLKKYLDMETAEVVVSEPESSEVLSATMGCYRSALRAIGKSAVRACSVTGSDLERNLTAFDCRLSENPTADLVKQTEGQVEDEIQKWGGQTAEYFKAKTEQVKELLIVLARTAESVGERDQRYAGKFSELTTRLKAIADLDDLTQIRASLVKGAAEMKNCVDQMAQDSHKSVAKLQAALSTYENKLKVVEQLALKDTLTNLANRRSIENRMEWHNSLNQTFCVVMLDLNGFKQTNDTYGHVAGDDLLKQFAHELQSNVRSADLVGRWGGDEFIVVVESNLTGAKSQVDRIQKWVTGEYKIQAAAGASPIKVHVEASIGLAEWQPGRSIQDVIKQADAAMYQHKNELRKQR